jgi:hypothetical protein
MRTRLHEKEWLVQYTKDWNAVWSKLIRKSNAYLKTIRFGRKSYTYRSLSFRKRMESTAADMILRIREGNLRDMIRNTTGRDRKIRHSPIGSGETKQFHISLILSEDGKTWSIENSTDKFMRQSYGRSPSLEFFIENKGHIEHNDIVRLLYKPVKRLFGEIVADNGREEADNWNDLSLGLRADFVCRARNNRRSFIEFSSRRVLTAPYIIKRASALLDLKSDKFISIALSWTKEAEEETLLKKSQLYTINADSGMKLIRVV